MKNRCNSIQEKATSFTSEFGCTAVSSSWRAAHLCIRYEQILRECWICSLIRWLGKALFQAVYCPLLQIAHEYVTGLQDICFLISRSTGSRKSFCQPQEISRSAYWKRSCFKWGEGSLPANESMQKKAPLLAVQQTQHTYEANFNLF